MQIAQPKLVGCKFVEEVKGNRAMFQWLFFCLFPLLFHALPTIAPGTLRPTLAARISAESVLILIRDALPYLLYIYVCCVSLLKSEN